MRIADAIAHATATDCMVLSSAEHLQHGLIDAARACAVLPDTAMVMSAVGANGAKSNVNFPPARLERAGDRLDRLAAAFDDQVRDRVLRPRGQRDADGDRAVRCASATTVWRAGWLRSGSRQTS